MSAAITPGIQPKIVSINTIKIEPQPLSMTANGGNKMDRITLQTLIMTNLQLIMVSICRCNFLLLQLLVNSIFVGIFVASNLEIRYATFRTGTSKTPKARAITKNGD